MQLPGHCRNGLGEFQRHPTKIDQSRSQPAVDCGYVYRRICHLYVLKIWIDVSLRKEGSHGSGFSLKLESAMASLSSSTL